MNKNFYFLALTGVALLFASCSKELFDKEVYDEFVDDRFMIDDMDPNHDWCLTKNDTLLVMAPDAGIYRVQVLTADPYLTQGSEIVADGVCYGGEAELTYTVPDVTTMLYLAALDDGGRYLGVVSFAYGSKMLIVTQAALTKSTTIYQPTPQTVTYLYESTFPIPDDFDYNDMVLRITKSYTYLSTQVSLTVSLAAAGTANSYAAAIHLGGVKYDDLVSVEMMEDEPMDAGYPFPRTLIKQSGTLIRGRNGEAVINLFENVHWVFGKKQNEMGQIPGIKYNTSHVPVENLSAEAEPVVRTFRINCKTRETARGITFDRIDPFIINNAKIDEAMDAGTWEIHTYPYKFTGVLWDCFTDKEAYDNHVSWAMIIPKSDFRYPLEGISMCTYQEEIDATFGPYEQFADWLKNHLTNHDWYLHVTREQLLY